MTKAHEHGPHKSGRGRRRPSRRLSRPRAWPLVGLAALALSGCGERVQVGEACVDSSVCGAGFGCFMADAGDTLCMRRCDPAERAVCEDGTLCFEADTRSGDGRSARTSAGDVAPGACMLGGSTGVGAPCTTNLECIKGALCVGGPAADSGAKRTCRLYCNTRVGAGCATGQVCAAARWQRAEDGYCSEPT